MNAHNQISLRWKDDSWEIWIDAESGQFEGICIGASPILQLAKYDAIARLVDVNSEIGALTEKDGIER